MHSFRKQATLGLLFTGALAAISPAQELVPQELSQSPAAFPIVGVDLWSTPIDPTPDDHGRWWASGNDYKVAFDDGVEFFPVLGPSAPQHLPLRWRTVGFRVGGQPWIEAETPKQEVQPKRFELGWGPIIEAYDLRVDGVEQSFVLYEAPANQGELEVIGRIDTPLFAAIGDATANDLVFVDATGRPTLSYGAVTVIDAAGRHLGASTSFDGELITIRVPGAWLEEASYPVVIDPLLSRHQMAGGVGDVSMPNVARDDSHNRILVTYGRQITASDFDFYARLLTDDFQTVAEVWNELQAGQSTRYGQAAYVYGASSWTVALGFEENGENYIKVRYRDGSSVVNYGGTIQTVPRPSVSFHARYPQLSGSISISSDYALLVYERDFVVGAWTATDATRIVAHRIDAQTQTISSQFFPRNAGPASYDAAAPSVSVDSMGDGWLVAWEERTDLSGSAWRIVGNRVDSNSNLETATSLGYPASNSLHKLRPKVAGSGGRFAVAFVTRTNTGEVDPGRNGSVLRIQRFDWAQGQAAPTMGLIRTLAGSQNDDFLLGLYSRNLAYDHNTDSHWGISYMDLSSNEVVAGRLGFGLQFLESVTVETNANGFDYYSPSMTFDDDADAFTLVYGEKNGSSRVVGRNLAHPTTALATSYGSACGGSLQPINQGPDVPRAGSEFFQLRFLSSAPGTPTWLYAATGPASIQIFGHACPILLNPSPTLILIGQEITDGSGNVTWDLALPEYAAGVDIHWQVLQVVGLTLQTSNGLRTNIR